MNELFFILAFTLFFILLGGFIRVLRGPTPADRMLSGQLFGTSGVAILLLLSEALEEPVLQNVALVFALLAIVTTVAFVRRMWVPEHFNQEVQ